MPAASSGSGKRKAMLAGGGVVGLAAVGAVAWGAMWYFGSGPQPAEALPDSTIGYVSIDIDPSGKQLLAAKETLEKFPVWNEQDISSKKDLREALFDKASEEADCDLDYQDDIKPWLGDALAVAAIDLGGDSETPEPVVVVQIKDADAAEKGIEKLSDCGGDSDEMGGYAIRGEWLLFAKDEETAKSIAEDAQKNPLSSDDDFKKWTDEAGDDGIVTMYASPDAGDYLADHPEEFDLESAPDEVTDMLRDFKGGAVKVRFADEGLEVESAIDASFTESTGLSDNDRGDDVLSTLPADTAFAFGVGFEDGWLDATIDSLKEITGESEEIESFISEFQEETGLSVPDDVETLLGESAVLSVSADIDPQEIEDEFFNGSGDGLDIPVGLKIKGDREEIEALLDDLRDSGAIPEDADEYFGTDGEGDFVVVSPSDSYREDLLEDGDLSGTDAFKSVENHVGDANSVMYVNFDAGGWLDKVGEMDEEIGKNLKPLQALALTSWLDGDVSHAMLRISTND